MILKVVIIDYNIEVLKLIRKYYVTWIFILERPLSWNDRLTDQVIQITINNSLFLSQFLSFQFRMKSDNTNAMCRANSTKWWQNRTKGRNGEWNEQTTQWVVIKDQRMSKSPIAKRTTITPKDDFMTSLPIRPKRRICSVLNSSLVTRFKQLIHWRSNYHLL